MKIIVFGGSGTLGKELQKRDPELICPTHQELDITSKIDVVNYIRDQKPDIVVNAAAIIDNRVLEGRPEQAIHVNIVGAANVASVCIDRNIRYVYISTDYVYKGDRGNYKETDEILPFNFYAWTKLGGECSAKGVKNHLIIRTSFGPSQFAYSQAFIDKWSSKDYVDVIAPMILEAVRSPLTGVVNIGTQRKTLYDYAITRNLDIRPVKLSETNFFTPYDTSFNLQKWADYKSKRPTARPHTRCRVCGSKDMMKYLDLGMMPLANNLEITSLRAKSVERYPLQVLFCDTCGLSQLSVVVDPEKLFSYYTYRSGINAGYITHCRKMAHDLLSRQKPGGFFHIDVAGNDGTLLKCFKETASWEYTCLNVDPASNLAAVSEHDGIPTMNDFWNTNTAGKILDDYGPADLITATNVFAHVHDIYEFLTAASISLKPDGVLVIECPYIVDFIENYEFDTVYFEHLSYMSVIPINMISRKLGLKIVKAEKQNIHGGSIRITLARDESPIRVEQSVEQFINQEVTFHQAERYTQWANEVTKRINGFRSELTKLKLQGYKIAGYGASAKGNTMLNSAGINTDIMDYIIDSTPEKIGKFSPGTGIPIMHPQELQKRPPDFLVILAWNFKETLMANAQSLGFKGKFILPVPKFDIL